MMKKRKRYVPIRLLIPNIVTLLGLCAGISAIRMAIESRFELAVFGILCAAALDGFDGRIARLLDATTEIGKELDSLADFVSFGVAPGVVLFVWSMQEMRSFGWIVVMIYCLCMALRLARFNVMSRDEEEWRSRFFVGVPAPIGAILVLLPLYFQFLEFISVVIPLPLILGHILLVAALSVSPIPTFSLKQVGFRIEYKHVLPVFLFGSIYVISFFTYTYGTLVASCFFYLISIPFSALSFKKARAMRAVAA